MIIYEKFFSDLAEAVPAAVRPEPAAVHQVAGAEGAHRQHHRLSDVRGVPVHDQGAVRGAQVPVRPPPHPQDRPQHRPDQPPRVSNVHQRLFTFSFYI